MTTRVRIGVELLDPCSFSRDSASAGGHVSLPFIPGAALLGLCAAAFHEAWSAAGAPVDSFTAFHSGALRFGDALPLGAGNAATYPAPRCWNEEKDGDALANLSVAAADRDKQYKPLRAGFVAFGEADGAAAWTKVSPRRESRLKTAIDPTTGVAATGLLFGQEALSPGQVFACTIEADEAAAPALESIVAHLVGGSGVHRIGRSRGAEYGRAKLTKLEPQPALAIGAAPGRTIVWCLSDVLPGPDWSGGAPPASLFGLAGGALDETRSFFGLRRHVPFNGAWRMRGPERLAIVAGSVLVFTDAGAAQPGERAVGLDRAAGFGRIVVDPLALRGAPPVRVDLDAPAPAGSATALPGPLGAWMMRRTESAVGRDVAAKGVEPLAKEIEGLLKSLRDFNSGSLAADGYPGRSQWNAIRNAAQRGGSIDALRQRLFAGDKPLARAEDPQWRGYCRSQRTAFQQFGIVIEGLAASGNPDPGLTLALAIELILRDFDKIMAGA